MVINGSFSVQFSYVFIHLSGLLVSTSAKLCFVVPLPTIGIHSLLPSIRQLLECCFKALHNFAQSILIFLILCISFVSSLTGEEEGGGNYQSSSKPQTHIHYRISHFKQPHSFQYVYRTIDAGRQIVFNHCNMPVFTNCNSNLHITSAISWLRKMSDTQPKPVENFTCSCLSTKYKKFITIELKTKSQHNNL